MKIMKAHILVVDVYFFSSRRRHPIFDCDWSSDVFSSDLSNDGAAAVVLAAESVAARRGLRPLGWLRSWAAVGVPPEIMGIGPAPASREALARAELRLDQIGVAVVNEAFAAQYLAVEKELGLNRRHVNPYG